MRRVQNSAVAYIVASLVALAGMLVSMPGSASAANGKIPDGPVNFYIMGGNLAFGGQLPGTLPINQNLAHPDVPPECSDGVDNELGSFHAWYTNNPTTGTPITPVGATDGRIDFGTATGQENSNLPVYTVGGGTVQNLLTPTNTGCETATDNSEMFDRRYIAPDPPYAPGPSTLPNGQPRGCIDFQPFGAPVTANVQPPGCGTNGVAGDACQPTQNGAATPCRQQWASTTFGNGATGQGQEKVRQSATGGTVSGTSVSVPQGNIQFGRGYQGQGQCQTQLGITACIDLYVEFAIQPSSPISGVTNPDGSGTVNTSFNLVVKLSMTYDSNDPFDLVPNAAICPTLNPINLNLTTGSSGSLVGTPYDTFRQNFKVVQDPFTVSAFATNQGQFGGTAANLCSELNKQLFGSDSPTAQATNGKAQLIISSQDTSNTTGSSASGTGMPWTVTNPQTISGPNWNPVAAVQVATNNGPQSAPMTSDQVVDVNEGDLVQLDTVQSYDPAMRPFTTNTFARTGGTAPALPAETGIPDELVNFVAQDSPSGGMTYVYQKQVVADLGPFDQTQQSTRTTTINSHNVAPTASAGPNRTVSGGVQTSLTGTSTDPGDTDTPGQRGYCWTQTGGTSVGLPACTGSPSNNRPSSGNKFTPLNFTPANANDTLTFQLVVCDKDGGCSAPSNTTITTRAQSASTISGIITDASAGGAPLSGATVALFNSGGFVGSTSTNGSGQYSFGGLPNGSSYFVSASSSGYSTVYFNNTQSANAAARLTVSGTAGRSDIDIPLRTAAQLGSISGHLSDLGGSDIAGMGVRLYDENGFVATTTSDGLGVYNFANLTPKSTYKLRFNCTSGCGASLPYVDTWHIGALTGNNAALVTVNLGSNTDVGTDTILRTSGPNEQATVDGTVTGLSVPLQGVQVRLYDFTTGAWVTSAVTNASGQYSMSALPGSYKLWFWTKNTSLAPPPPLATQARSSQWYDGAGFLTGEQTAGTGKLVTSSLDLSAGGTVTVSPDLP